MKLVLDAQNKVIATHDNDQMIEASYPQAASFKIVPDSAKVDYDSMTYDVTGCSLEEMKEAKKGEIELAFMMSEMEAVEEVNGTFWVASERSCFKIDGAIRLAEKKSATEVTLTDRNDKAFTLPYQTAVTVSLVIAENFQERFMIKQGLINQVDEAGSVVALDDLTINFSV